MSPSPSASFPSKSKQQAWEIKLCCSLSITWKQRMSTLQNESECVNRSVLTLCDPMACSPPGPSVHGILQAWMEWLPCASPGEFSQPRDQTRVSCIAGRFFTIWVTRETTFQNNCKQNESAPELCWSLALRPCSTFSGGFVLRNRQERKGQLATRSNSSI